MCTEFVIHYIFIYMFLGQAETFSYNADKLDGTVVYCGIVSTLQCKIIPSQISFNQKKNYY